MHNAMRKLQVWNQLLVICLNTPPAAYLGIPCISMSRHPDPPPPPNQITQQRCQSTGLELRIPKIYLLICGPVILETPPKSPDPPGPHPPFDPLRIDSFMYQLIALDVRTPNM